MKTIRNTFFYITSFGLLSLLAWANWEKPPLSAGLPPIKLAVWQLESLDTKADSVAIATELARQAGITAFAVNLKSKLVTITFHEGTVQESQVIERLSNKNFAAKTFNFDQYDGPQCPVPMEYIQAIYKVKEVFRFRK